MSGRGGAALELQLLVAHEDAMEAHRDRLRHQHLRHWNARHRLCVINLHTCAPLSLLSGSIQTRVSWNLNLNLRFRKTEQCTCSIHAVLDANRIGISEGSRYPTTVLLAEPTNSNQGTKHSCCYSTAAHGAASQSKNAPSETGSEASRPETRLYGCYLSVNNNNMTLQTCRQPWPPDPPVL